MIFRPFAKRAEYARHNTGRALKGLVWLFSALLLLGIWAFVLQQTRFERQNAIDEAIAQNVNRVIAFEQYVQRTLEVAAISTRYIADRFQRGEQGAEFAGTPDRPAMMRGNFARGQATFISISIANARGDIIATSRNLPGPANVARYLGFRVHLARDTGQIYVGRPFPSPFERRNFIFLSRRLNNPDGSIAGVVALAILPEQFAAFYRDARVGPNDVLSLIGLDGITRVRRTGPVASSGEDLRGRLVMRMQMQNPNGTYLGPNALTGQVYYFSHRRLPNYPLFVTFGIPEAEVLASPRRRAAVLIAAASLGTLVTIAFAALLTLLINRTQRRTIEIARENVRLEEAQRIGAMGDWRYDVKARETHWSLQLYKMHERDPSLGPISTGEYRALLNEHGRDAIDGAVAGVFKTGADQDFQIKLHLPSGAEMWHQVSAVALRGADGQVTGLRGTSQDITDRKRLERLETHVAQLSRVEAMNAMAATLAHELNQPLAAAANYLVGSRRRIAAAPADSAAIQEGVTAAEQQIHFAGDIIRRVREMVSNRPKTLSNFALSPVIDDAVALIAGAAGSPRPDIRKQLDAEASQVYADRVQVQQVLINLLRNALQATKAVSNPEIVVAARAGDDEMILVSVSDNGPGFSQPKAGRFSPFKSEGEAGMGLGLSISRTIVESNGGRIWTEDREEGGARVCFSLPIARARASRSPEPDATQTPGVE